MSASKSSSESSSASCSNLKAGDGGAPGRFLRAFATGAFSSTKGVGAVSLYERILAITGEEEASDRDTWRSRRPVKAEDPTVEREVQKCDGCGRYRVLKQEGAVPLCWPCSRRHVVLIAQEDATDQMYQSFLDGDAHRALRGRGLGQALIREALRRARLGDWPLVLVSGEVDYYPKFGFVPAAPYDLDWPGFIEPERLQFFELQQGALESLPEGPLAVRPVPR